MSSLLWFLLASLGIGIVIAIWFGRNTRLAYARISGNSTIVPSPLGDIEFKRGGTCVPVLVIHGSGGGYDQGELIAKTMISPGLRPLDLAISARPFEKARRLTTRQRPMLTFLIILACKQFRFWHCPTVAHQRFSLPRGTRSVCPRLHFCRVGSRHPQIRVRRKPTKRATRLR
jgi:hypothetical protein